MQLNVNSAIMVSESASKKAQNNAKTFFGSKGVAILSKLEEYKKEKLLATQHIDTLVTFLSKASPEQVEKFAASAPGKKAKPLFAKVAQAKTLSALLGALKAAKAPASLAKLVSAPSPVSEKPSVDSGLPDMFGKGMGSKGTAKLLPATATELAQIETALAAYKNPEIVASFSGAFTGKSWKPGGLMVSMSQRTKKGITVRQVIVAKEEGGFTINTSAGPRSRKFYATEGGNMPNRTDAKVEVTQMTKPVTLSVMVKKYIPELIRQAKQG